MRTCRCSECHKEFVEKDKYPEDVWYRGEPARVILGGTCYKRTGLKKLCFFCFVGAVEAWLNKAITDLRGGKEKNE